MTKRPIPKMAKSFKQLFNDGLENKILLLFCSIIVIPFWIVLVILTAFFIPEGYRFYMFIVAICLPMILIFTGATILALVEKIRK